jgi:hypothetical protein
MDEGRKAEELRLGIAEDVKMLGCGDGLMDE